MSMARSSFGTFTIGRIAEKGFSSPLKMHYRPGKGGGECAARAKYAIYDCLVCVCGATRIPRSLYAYRPRRVKTRDRRNLPGDQRRDRKTLPCKHMLEANGTAVDRRAPVLQLKYLELYARGTWLFSAVSLPYHGSLCSGRLNRIPLTLWRSGRVPVTITVRNYSHNRPARTQLYRESTQRIYVQRDAIMHGGDN